MKVLLIIDMQYDFLPGGSLAVSGGDEVVAVINKLQHKFDLIVATQDWHPANHRSFAVNHENAVEFETIDLHGLKQVLWPAHCIQGTLGAEIAAELSTDKVAMIIRKGMDSSIDSYSAFYDNGKRRDTGLSGFLKGLKVKEVYIAGLAADYCVYFSAMDAREEGFNTFIVEDATRAIDAKGWEKAKKNFTAAGGRLVNSTDFVA